MANFVSSIRSNMQHHGGGLMLFLQATRKPYVSHYLSVKEEFFDNQAIHFSEQHS
jgi:hypothetical protein